MILCLEYHYTDKKKEKTRDKRRLVGLGYRQTVLVLTNAMLVLNRS